MLKIEQLAAELGISTRQVQRLQSAGLPFTPVGVRQKRYDLDACKRWLSENYSCLSSHSQTVGTKSPCASTINAYTDTYRRAQLRVMPSDTKPNSSPLSASPRLSRVTPD